MNRKIESTSQTQSILCARVLNRTLNFTQAFSYPERKEKIQNFGPDQVENFIEPSVPLFDLE